jgi:GNAT superfamily N-acetyltransferase
MDLLSPVLYTIIRFLNDDEVKTMQFNTYDHINIPQWLQAQRLYHQAFPKGRKPDSIISSMFAKRMSFLHTMTIDSDLAAMAITGDLQKANVLLIDYLAVDPDQRGQGLGLKFVNAIKHWAYEGKKLSGVIVEVESEPTQENESRIRFWQRCGFTWTEYVHHYIWVPEPYRALYASFDEKPNFPTNGETLFRLISDFHKRAFLMR